MPEDEILVLPGEFVPIDDVIVIGGFNLEEPTVTGESLPVDNGAVALVFA